MRRIDQHTVELTIPERTMSNRHAANLDAGLSSPQSIVHLARTHPDSNVWLDGEFVNHLSA